MAPEEQTKILESYSTQAIKTLNELSQFAEKTPTVVLISTGLGSIIFGLVSKIQVNDVNILSLQPKEFITLYLVGALLTLAGCIVRIQQIIACNNQLDKILENATARRQEAEQAESSAQTQAVQQRKSV